MYADHKPLKYIYAQPHLNARQARWLERLAELDLDIVYKPGVENVAADVLTRYGCRVWNSDDVSIDKYSLTDG